MAVLSPQVSSSPLLQLRKTFLWRLEDGATQLWAEVLLLPFRGGRKHVGAAQCMYTVYLDTKKFRTRSCTKSDWTLGQQTKVHVGRCKVLHIGVIKDIWHECGL